MSESGPKEEEARNLLDKEEEVQNPPGTTQKGRKAVFFSNKDGVYFTFTAQEIKIQMCRVLMQALLVALCFTTYYIAWGVCDTCILIITAASCGGACSGLGFLTPSCWAGILASLLRGFRVGNELAHVDVHWKI